LTRVLITGSRSWQPTALVNAILARLVRRYGHHLVIVHGACNGVDRTFAVACRSQGVADEPHPAAWDKHGKAAGPIRNREMLESGAAFCLAFHPTLATSKGTGDMVRQVLDAGVSCWWYWSEEGEPKRLKTWGDVTHD